MAAGPSVGPGRWLGVLDELMARSGAGSGGWSRGGERGRSCWACWPSCPARTAGPSPSMPRPLAGQDAAPAGPREMGCRRGPRRRASTALAALAAGAAWVAARATRDSARQISNGNLIEAHAARLENLRKIHTDVSYLSSSSTNWRYKRLETLGRIQATGCQLPRCQELCERTERTELDDAAIFAAEAELRAAMAKENERLARLEGDKAV
jgi:hypothetical protein